MTAGLCLFAMLLFAVVVVSRDAYADGKPVTMRVGVYENEPKVFTGSDGQALGLFPDVMRGIADDFGWNLSFVDCNWSDCLKMLEAGDLDIMTDVAYTEARARRFKFGREAVLHSWSYIYTSRNNVVQALDDLDGKRIALLKNSIQQKYLREESAEGGWSVEYVETSTVRMALEAVADGRADYAIVNHFHGERLEDEFGLVRSEIVFQPSTLHFAFSNEIDDDTIAQTDVKIAEMKSNPDSLYYRSYGTWLTESGRGELPEWLYWLSGGIVFALIFSFLGNALLRRRIARATKALHESEQKLIQAQIIARSGDFTWDLRTDEVSWSDGMCVLLGYEPGTAITLEEILNDIHHPADAAWVMEWLAAGINAGEDYLEPRRYRLRCKDGSLLFVETNVRIDRDNGEAVRLFGACHDITEQIRAERAILSAKNDAEKANRTKSKFLASVSHELRTPLNAILAFSDIIWNRRLGEDSASKYQEYAGDIHSSAQHLLRLVNELLDISAIEAGNRSLNFEAARVDEIVDNCLREVEEDAAKKQVSIENNVTESIENAHIDSGAIRQVGLNVLGNAVEYTDDGGVVSVHADYVKGGVEIRVSDNGVGIPADALETITTPFAGGGRDPLTAQGGPGLGLALSRSLVELHGGSLSVESEEGVGTHVAIFLPDGPV